MHKKALFNLITTLIMVIGIPQHSIADEQEKNADYKLAYKLLVGKSFYTTGCLKATANKQNAHSSDKIDAPLCQCPIPLCLDGTTSYDITASGHYSLESDVVLNSSQSYLFSISADDVTLDLCGHTISGAGATQNPLNPQTGIVIAAGLRNVSILNGAINNFSFGVDFQGTNTNPVETVLLQDLNVDYQIGVGTELVSGVFPVRAARGIILDGTNNVTLRRVSASYNSALSTIGNVTLGTIGFGLNSHGYVYNLTVEDSHFDGNTGSTANGVRYQFNVVGGGIAYRNHSYKNCTFNNNSDLDFPSIIPGFGLKFGGGLSYEYAGPDVFAENISIENSEASGNLSQALAFGIETNYTNGSLLDHVIFQGNVNSGDIPFLGGSEQLGSAYGFKPKASNNVTIRDCDSSENLSLGGFVGAVSNPVRAMGFYFPQSTSVVIENSFASGNKVIRKQPNGKPIPDGKGIGFASFQQAANVPGCSELFITGAVAEDNDIGFGFSNVCHITLQNSAGNNNGIAGLWLVLLGRSTLNEIQTQNLTATDNKFISNGKYGVFDNTEINTHAYLRNYAAFNKICNYKGLPRGTPIRKWTLGHKPAKPVAGAEIDNISVTEGRG